MTSHVVTLSIDSHIVNINGYFCVFVSSRRSEQLPRRLLQVLESFTKSQRKCM